MKAALAAALAGRAAAELLRPRRVSQAVVFVSDRCNASCPYCFNGELEHLAGAVARGRPLTAGEYDAAARGLGSLVQVVFGGGEPFLREDLPEIAAAFHERCRPRLFSIPTNGSLVKRTTASLDRLARACPGALVNLVVSLDAVGERHDRMRGLPGGYEKALELCRRVRALGRKRTNVGLVISTAVTADNLGEVLPLREALKTALGDLPPHNVQFDQRADGRLWSDPATRERAAALERVLSRRRGPFERLYVGLINGMILRQMAEGRMLYRCAAGRKTCVILPDGRVGPCEPFLFDPHYAAFPALNLRDHGYDYYRLREAEAMSPWLARIERSACRACPWSCAAITSALYEPLNWRRFARMS